MKPGPRLGSFCCTNAVDTPRDSRSRPRQYRRMGDVTDDELFLGAVDAVVLDELERNGDRQKAR